VRLVMRIMGMLATGNVRGLATLVLGLTLVGGLWETSLYNLSSRATATSVMTEVGVELINPVLVNNSLGLSNTLYTALLAQAKSNPSQALSIPGLKIQVTGREIAGKSFADGSRVIYQKVASGYYDGGWTAVLAVPDSLTHAFGALAVLPQAVASQGAKQVGAPQLPNVPLPPLGAVGLSLQTFTAEGHAQVASLVKWFLGIAAAAMVLLALASQGWRRLTAPAWALISGALPGAFGMGVIAFFWARSSKTFAPYAGLLHLIAGAYVPVYVGAIVIGVVALIAAWLGDIITHSVGVNQAAKAHERAQAAQLAAYSAPAPMYRPPASASGASGYGDWGGYQERRPIGGPGGNVGGRPAYPQGPQGPQAPQGRPAPRYGPAGPNAPAWHPSPQGSAWQEPRPARPPYSNPNWGQQPTPPPPAGPPPGWAPPDDSRPPYGGPSWADDPASSQWPPDQAADPRLRGAQDAPGGQWPDAPPWDSPQAPPSRSPYGQSQPRGGRPGASGQPYGGRDSREQGSSRPDDGWGSSGSDDPWAPRGR
jgi:hypothetical protein